MQYQPKVDDKITVKGLLHVKVTEVFSDDDLIFETKLGQRFDVDGFREESDGNHKPLEDEMSVQEIENLLERRGGRIYRPDPIGNGEFTIILSGRNGNLR